MIAIPFPLSNSPGQHPQEAAGRLINAFAEPLGAKARAQAKWRRAPGLGTFGTTARTGCRGFIEINNVLYGAFNGQLEKWTSSGGASTNVGALTGTSKCFFFRNNKTPTPDQFVVDPDQGAFIFTSSSVSSYPDGDLPAVNSGCAFDGYGVFTTGDGRIFATDLNSTAVNALRFAKAEANPDGLIRILPWGDHLFAFGQRSIESWVDAGNTPFPFERSVVIAKGLIGRYAVAGYEDGFTRGIIFVADDNGVYQLDGYQPKKISPPDLDHLIEAVTDKTTLEACVYTVDGHGMWQLSSPTWTWVFNTNSQTWHERQSYGLARSRITTSHNAFGKWIVGDTQSGNALYISTASFFEVTSPLRMRIESGPVSNFPARMVCHRADFDLTTGVGIATGTVPIQTDPKVEISWSDDGGISWSNTVLRNLGEQALGDRHITVRRTGRTSVKGRRWRIDISDPVPVSLFGGDMQVEARK